VSPRRNLPRNRRKPPEEEERGFSLDLEASAPPGWQARAIAPARAVKEYRCPGCNQQIRLGVAHVVAWKESDEEGRRHWHTPCWSRARHSAERNAR
jgi:hypothetical protein